MPDAFVVAAYYFQRGCACNLFQLVKLSLSISWS